MSTLPAYAPVEFPEYVHLDITFLFLGTMANWILFGTLCVQVYLYYIAFPKDRRLLKWIVAVQFLLQAVQTTMLAHDAIQPFTVTFIDTDLLGQTATLWFSVVLIIGLIASINQGFYCYRIGVLTQSKRAVALISVLSLSQLAAAIIVSVQAKRTVRLITLLSQKTSLIAIGVWGTCSLACDIVIAAIMTYHLRKRDTGFANTHGIIVRLIRLSIETGCVTALSAAVLLILVYLPGHPPYYIAAASLVAKIYSSSMMAVLNSRVRLASNAPGFAAPLWNESARRTESISATGRYRGIVFRRESEMDFSASRI